VHGHALGSPRLYDLVAAIAFVGRRRAVFQALIAAVGVHAGQRVLDVGCGTGYFARLLARAVGPGGLVIGIDPSQAMIDYARRRADGTGTCAFRVGTAEALEFPAEHFDVVVASLMLHHLPDELRVPALREMGRVLRPAGNLLVAEAQTSQHGLGWRLLGRLHGFDQMARRVPHLEPLAAEAGFDQIRAGDAPPWLRYLVAAKPTT
jgi:ubiquinone/menaquinone biosynthesis C-methylase UbiE